MSDDLDTTGQNDTGTSETSAQEDGTIDQSTDTGDTGSATDDGAVDAAAVSDEGADALPEAYEFGLPEGVEFDEGFTDKLGEAYKELGLNQDQADAMTGMLASTKQATEEAEETEFKQQLDEWGTELRNDQELGGENFDANMAKVREFIDATVPSDLKEDFNDLLNGTGVGSHPAMVKYFHHMMNNFPVGEDNPGSGDAVLNKGDAASRMYPDLQ